MASVILTARAIEDLREIERFSFQQWGDKTTNNYLDDFDHALTRLEENPGLLSKLPEIASNLRFYRVRKLFILCDRIDDIVYVLAIVHCSMDLPNHLARYEPTLLQEAKILHRKLKEKSDD